MGSTPSTSRARTTSTRRCGRRSSRAHDDLELFDRAFDAWFLRGPRAARSVRRTSRRPRRTGPSRETPRDGLRRRRGAVGETRSSAPRAAELLRGKDFAEMTPEELERAAQADGGDRRARGRSRRSRRRAPDPRGDALDLRRCVRALARARAATRSSSLGGARKTVPRKLVVLCDVSGSMEPYARALLLFLHALVGTGQRRRGVRVRHAAHAADPGARGARPGARARARRRSGPSTGRAARGSARR